MKKLIGYSILAFLLVVLFTGCASRKITHSEYSRYFQPKREFRGAWIQTVFQDEYAQMTPKEMRQDFIRKLNRLEQLNINALLFQVRPEADAWYPSDLEPWSRFLTGKQGVAPSPEWDPMAFLIKECHKRGIEFHAWINPYRAFTQPIEFLANKHIYYAHPNWFVQYGKLLIFNPGIPECRRYINRVVQDIVSRYDVDAIHMDDYFYPYPNGTPFPDDDTFLKYGIPKGYTAETKNDWRRENVNLLIKELKQTISAIKPWVRLGISPFGIYRNKKNDPDGSETSGLQNYDDLYADVLLWSQKGWADYVLPQLYWEIGHKTADYKALLPWWANHANNRHLYIGQHVGRTMKFGQLHEKLSSQRSYKSINGHCFWPANELFWNNGHVADSLSIRYQKYKALIPAYTFMHHKAPKKVKNLHIEYNRNGIFLHWNAKQDAHNPKLAYKFVVYRFAPKEKIDLNNTSAIIAITPNQFYLIPYEGKKTMYTYVVTALDRYNNESKPSRKIKFKL